MHHLIHACDAPPVDTFSTHPAYAAQATALQTSNAGLQAFLCGLSLLVRVRVTLTLTLTLTLTPTLTLKARARPPVDVLTHHMYPLGAGNLAEMHGKSCSRQP